MRPAGQLLRRFLSSCILLCSIYLTNLSPVSAQQLGINLARLHDWNSELPFVDVFRLSRSWVSQEEGKPWGHGPPLQLDNKGWIKTLQYGTWAETCIVKIRGGYYPHGTYSLLYEELGKININNANGRSGKEKGWLSLRLRAMKR